MIQVWANRFYMGNDGVSYLDMADAYLRADWHVALNTSWNPLYAWLICLDFLVFRPSPYWEFTAVQLLNYGIYVLAVASFEYFLQGWLEWKRGDETAVRVIAYGLFLWTSLILIGTWTANADMLVSACIYTALGMILRAHTRKTISAGTSILLGLTLAAGYYSKAIMFPFALFLLLIALIVLKWQRALVTIFVFAIISAPLIVEISKVAGHPTIGETGRVNYSWYVDGVAQRWWQGGPPKAGMPLHPPRIALDSPRVYEFNSAFPKATYPIWYDFAYWYQGVRVWIPLRHEAKVIVSNIVWILELLVIQGGGFLLGWAASFLASKNKSQIASGFGFTWPAWVASIAALLLYSAVHVEARYIGAFVTILFLAAYMAVGIHGKRMVAGIVALGLLWSFIFAPEPTFGASYLPVNSAYANVPWQVANDLEEIGLRANDKVGSVYYSNRQNVFWARLARVHIVAEADWNVDFWRLSGVDQRRVLAALAHSGAVMAVADRPPPDPAQEVGWRPLGSTNFYAFPLSQLSEPLQDGAIPAGEQSQIKAAQMGER